MRVDQLDLQNTGPVTRTTHAHGPFWDDVHRSRHILLRGGCFEVDCDELRGIESDELRLF